MPDGQNDAVFADFSRYHTAFIRPGLRMKVCAIQTTPNAAPCKPFIYGSAKGCHRTEGEKHIVPDLDTQICECAPPADAQISLSSEAARKDIPLLAG